jgi:serine/threonine protein kinase
LHVRKYRRFYAPLLVAIGNPLVRLLDTGVRVLAQGPWIQRERMMYRTLHAVSIRVDRDGTLVLPCLPGETLATMLDNAGLDESTRKRSIELAVTALAELHGKGLTHGDAMADNVMIDLDGGIARWFDFETAHDQARAAEWRRADDVRALLATCLARTAAPNLGETLVLILSAYGDESVAGQLSESFTPLRRSLPFHLGQAALSFRQFREIGRLILITPPSPSHPPRRSR